METQTTNPKQSRVYLHSSHVEKIEDYPFGRHRTTGTAWIEFKPGHGFRFCRQLVDPKTGRNCAPKKSTYEEIALPFYNENGHFKMAAFNTRDISEGANYCLGLIGEFFHLWNDQEREYIKKTVLASIKVSMHAAWVYTGINDKNGFTVEQLGECFKPAIQTIAASLGNDQNPFTTARLNVERFNELKNQVPKNWSPFVQTTYKIDFERGQLTQIPNE
jgi:hypothetical protein